MKFFRKIKRGIRQKLVDAVLIEIKQKERNDKLPYQVLDGLKRQGQNSFFWGDDHIITGNENLTLGENVHIGNNAFIRAEGGLEIGDNTHISRNLVLYTINHDYNGSTLPYDEGMISKKVTIGKNVWIGMNVCIVPGTIIGDGCIIGMGTTVSGEIPPLSIVASPKCVILKSRDEEHYRMLDKAKRFGGPNGQLYNRGFDKQLRKEGDTFIARRSTSTLLTFKNKPAVKKEFLATVDGLNAFKIEKEALERFSNFKWCPKIFDVGENCIITEYFKNEHRLDQISNPDTKILGEILWGIFEIFEQGFSHRDIHSRNIFITDNGIKFIDFETVWPIANDTDFWDSYDITGAGAESPFFTGNMCVMHPSEDSLKNRFQINSVNDMRVFLDREFEKRMYDSSITFRTLRDGKDRHQLMNPKIYSSFSLMYTTVPAERSQRDTFKRLQRFGIKKDMIAGKRVLDIGSNIGATLLNLYHYNPSEMIGLEYDHNKVDISQKLAKYNKIERAKFYGFDIEIDDLDEGTFDVVFCLAVVEHIKNKARLFNLLANVTRDVLFFEGNARTDVDYISQSLTEVGFSEIKYLGLSDDELNEGNNNRPLFIAKK